MRAKRAVAEGGLAVLMPLSEARVIQLDYITVTVLSITIRNTGLDRSHRATGMQLGSYRVFRSVCPFEAGDELAGIVSGIPVGVSV